jgi:hypothetical protein
MYSGTTLHGKSGRLMGVHQKIDRVARRHLTRHLTHTSAFPSTRQILHFEGMNGPDGLKRKHPGKDEPWHFIDPDDVTKGDLLTIIHDHIINLAAALRSGNNERAAFEAAWMAHAISDGLTPAHHYPLEEKLSELRGGAGLESRDSKRKKVVLPGTTKRLIVKNNWEFWGAKGVMTTHLGFEFGIASAVSAMKFDTLSFDPLTFKNLNVKSFDSHYRASIQRVAGMQMYQEFALKGWTRHLARETKNVLVPEIIRMVMLGWLTAIEISKEN